MRKKTVSIPRFLECGSASWSHKLWTAGVGNTSGSHSILQIPWMPKDGWVFLCFFCFAKGCFERRETGKHLWTFSQQNIAAANLTPTTRRWKVTQRFKKKGFAGRCLKKWGDKKSRQPEKEVCSIIHTTQPNQFQLSCWPRFAFKPGYLEILNTYIQFLNRSLLKNTSHLRKKLETIPKNNPPNLVPKNGYLEHQSFHPTTSKAHKIANTPIIHVQSLDELPRDFHPHRLRVERKRFEKIPHPLVKTWDRRLFPFFRPSKITCSLDRIIGKEKLWSWCRILLVLVIGGGGVGCTSRNGGIVFYQLGDD